VWHDVSVSDETHSKRLRRESDERLAIAAKLIEHAETIKARAAELQKQIARLARRVKQKKA
jgi:predicted HTH domain antitoxin